MDASMMLAGWHIPSTLPRFWSGALQSGASIAKPCPGGNGLVLAACARMCILCPITTQVKGYPFEVAVPEGGKTTGAVLADQIRSFDWSARQADFIENRADLAPEVLGKVRAILRL